MDRIAIELILGRVRRDPCQPTQLEGFSWRFQGRVKHVAASSEAFFSRAESRGWRGPARHWRIAKISP